MRIAFLSTFYPFRGGIAQSNAQIYRAFERQGDAVKMWNFTTQYPKLLFPGTTQMVNEKDQADPIPGERMLSSINPLTFGKTIRSILDWKPDMIILRYWMPFFAPSLGYVAKRLRKRGVKVVAVIDNLIPHEHRIGDKQLTNYFLNRCDGFVVMSDVVEKNLKSVKPAAEHIFYPHPLYDQFGKKLDKTLAKTQLKLDPAKKVLLYFGLIRKYKGLDILIEAFNQLDESYELLIVGEPYEDYKTYQDLIDINKNKDRIHSITRYVSDEEVPLYFSVADVCVLPYRTATQSGVTAISYHFDLPVIVTDVGGLRGSVEPYGAGMVVDRPDPSEFGNAIKKYFIGTNQAEMTKAIGHFKAKYTWDGMVAEIKENFK